MCRLAEGRNFFHDFHNQSLEACVLTYSNGKDNLNLWPCNYVDICSNLYRNLTTLYVSFTVNDIDIQAEFVAFSRKNFSFS
jgi:hypothetical protein